MGIKEHILIQIKGIVEESNSKIGLFGFGLDISFIDDSVNIGKLITKAKVLVSDYFGEDNHYFKQVDECSGKFDKNSLKQISSALTALFENYKKDIIPIKKPHITSLKFKKIIEINLQDVTYKEVIAEINGTYFHQYFTSMYIMVRKLLENLLYDCLKAYYGTQDVEKYYNTGKNRHQGYGVLIDNFNNMINDQNFKTIMGDVDQKFIDLLKDFQETGNRNAHSLFNLAHRGFIEDRKDDINSLIKKLDWIIQKL